MMPPNVTEQSRTVNAPAVLSVRVPSISVRELLTRAEVSKEVNYITFRGPEGNYEKIFRVPLNDVLTDKVFLAYQVNGEVLLRKHGFPLRIVAEGYYGSDWVKYVYKVTADVVRG
jgi:DMSO/TMAO reductase YedYZ molybdopterin-dependent catalytic subunit